MKNHVYLIFSFIFSMIGAVLATYLNIKGIPFIFFLYSAILLILFTITNK